MPKNAKTIHRSCTVSRSAQKAVHLSSRERMGNGVIRNEARAIGFSPNSIPEEKSRN